MKLDIVHQAKLLIKCESTIKIPWRMLGLKIFVTQRHTFKKKIGGQLNLLEETHILKGRLSIISTAKI